ncbi:hypothetical protein HYQ44_003328 [Verticillium longisporum]|nr:hypothetical protein HYQ44_003328 [Verticillium longisporum]
MGGCVLLLREENLLGAAGAARAVGAVVSRGGLLAPDQAHHLVVRGGWLVGGFALVSAVDGAGTAHRTVFVRRRPLGFPVKGLCADEFISPFNYQDGHRPSSQPSHPESLSPTALQRTVRHHPWVDLFPLARLRDNVLRGLNSGAIDEDELCSDLLNVEDRKWSDVEKPSLILWGESWDIKGWEASAAFLRKWGWITQGCPELIEGTNYWRRIRGEQGIVFDFGLVGIKDFTGDNGYIRGRH